MNPGEKITADRPCCITGSHDCEIVATKAREGHALRNVICRESGLIYVDPLPIEDLETFYKEDYRKSYKNVVVPKKKHILRAGRVALSRFEQAQGVIESRMRCLDIGAGGGEWVYLLNRLGCDAVGIEPNKGYGGFARETYDVEVFSGMYQESNFEKETFDVLSLFQVLEHLADPVVDIRSMSEYLKPGGKFIIEVPDILFPGMHFDHKWHDGHLYGFDVKTLEAVAARAGLKTVSLKITPGNLYGIFEKPGDSEKVEVPSLEGNFESALEQLDQGRKSYWTMPRTYGKTFRKLSKAINEKSTVASLNSGREILDSIYGPKAG